MNFNRHLHLNLRVNDAILRKAAIVLTWVGGLLLLLKLVAEVISRIWGGGAYADSNSLEPSTEAYRLIVSLGLIFGGFLIYGRLGKIGKLLAEAVWLVVLWNIILWFSAQSNLSGGWRLLNAVTFSLIFVTVLCMLLYLLYSQLFGSGQSALPHGKSTFQ